MSPPDDRRKSHPATTGTTATRSGRPTAGGSRSSLRDAAGRIAGYLLQVHSEQGGTNIALPGLKKHIASHLNLTSETLSRTLRQLLDDKLIAETPNGLLIEDMQGLRRIAEGFYPQL